MTLEALRSEIDHGAMTAFTEVVFDGLAGIVPIRMLAETGTPDQKPQSKFVEVTQLTSALPDIAKHAARAVRGIYAVPGIVSRPGSARARDIIATQVLLVDLDSGDISLARDYLCRHLGEPSLEVASGGRTDVGEAKLHLYWRLHEPARGDDLERIRSLREMVALKVGGDASFGSLHQPIRVPGSIHGKNGKLTAVRLLARGHGCYPLDELLARAAAMPPLSGIPEVKPRQRKPAVSGLMSRKVLAGGLDDLTRFEALSRVIGHWIRQARLGHVSLDDARRAVIEHNAALIMPPWDDAGLEREFTALLQKDIRENGPMPTRKPDDAARDAPSFREDAIAASFVDRHAGEARHCSALGGWMSWTGTHWRRDDRDITRELMRQVCRSVAKDTDSPAMARRIASDRTVSATLRLAAADPAISSSVDAWDAIPMALNTTAGLVDLETGELQAHGPARLVTQIAGAAPRGDCPLWMNFLDQITDGDRDLQAYLQRMAGYCLTGSTREQVFFFFHGTGANGKTVFLQTLSAVL
ncbi:hypothetical protein MLD63_16670, partial [Paracoccus sp. TK19116]|nr:hypothetical protein [Paracoccus albicereus]